MTVTEELNEIAKNDPKGTLYPKAVLRFARRHKDSELHACLEWDDRVAADEYRIQQIRRLIEGTQETIEGRSFNKWIEVRDPKLR